MFYPFVQRRKATGWDPNWDSSNKLYPWLKSFGALRSLHAETVRINAIIENEFGQIEPADRV